MAALQERNGSYRVLFKHRGKQHTFTLGKVSEAEAAAKAAQVDYLLMRLKQGLIALPAGADVVEFVRHDGNPPAAAAPTVAPSPRGLTLGELRDRYVETHSGGTLERHTLAGIRRHFGHLTRKLGHGFRLPELTPADLQGYVNHRAKAKGRRGTLDPATIKKEVVTLRTAWNWAARMGLLSGRCPADGLRYAKSEEKPPFMTRAEIKRRLPGLPPDQAGELWNSMYLTLPEIERFLEHVREHAAHSWIHPMVATAAHTGARRGELLRMRVADVDFGAGSVVLRERKRVHGRRTTRRVPLSSALAAILRDWLAIHPGGDHLFTQADVVGRSRKRSRTTGHAWKDRPTTGRDRAATVRERECPGFLPVTEGEARHHFQQTLSGSEWDVVRGWHTLRHSFLSACAVKGVDQRYIDEWAGHRTEEQRRRYRHLAPEVQADKLKSVFG